MTASPDTGELPVVTPEGAPESPLVPSPTDPPAWYVSLVPPKDSLPLDFDPLAATSSEVGAAVEMVSVETVLPVVELSDSSAEAPAPPAELPPRLVVPGPRVEQASPGIGPVTPAGTTWQARVTRLRSVWSQGLPTGLTVLLVAALMTPGVVLDVARDGSFGLPSTVFFLLTAAGTPLLLRPRSLASAVVLPPLVFAGAAAAIAWRSGFNVGTRQIGLDVGTTMALNAPLIFGGTLAALVVVAVRLTVRLARR